MIRRVKPKPEPVISGVVFTCASGVTVSQSTQGSWTLGTPAGHTNFIREIINSGLITPEHALEILEEND